MSQAALVALEDFKMSLRLSVGIRVRALPEIQPKPLGDDVHMGAAGNGGLALADVGTCTLQDVVRHGIRKDLAAIDCYSYAALMLGRDLTASILLIYLVVRA